MFNERKGIKAIHNVCWNEIKLHTETPQLSVAELSPWRKEKIEKNIKNLCLYLDELVGQLDKVKIEQYIAEKPADTIVWLPFQPDPLLLTFNSYYGMVLTDLFWIGDITVADVVHISKRELELSLLGKYVAGQITKIKEMLSTHPMLFAKHNMPFDSLNEAFVCQKRSLYKGFNLIMITSIENIVKNIW